jgi:hypothetical protein
MLTETLLGIFLRDWSMFSSDDLSLAAGKMCTEFTLSPVAFRYYFTESQAASCKHFQCQNRRFIEAGYWKDFYN